MSATLTAKLEERIDDTTLQRVREEVSEADGGAPHSTAPSPAGWFGRFLEDTVARSVGQRHLLKLAAHRGRVSDAWRELPERMHLVANPTKLIFEVAEDFGRGKYR